MIKWQVFVKIKVLVVKRGLVNMVRFLISLQNLFNSRLFRIHRKKTSVIYVGKYLVTHAIYVDIRKFIQEGNPSNVQNVPRRLTIAHFLLNIGEFTLERNLINVQNVAKPLTTTQTSFNIGEFIWERSLTNVQNVAKPLSVPHI